MSGATGTDQTGLALGPEVGGSAYARNGHLRGTRSLRRNFEKYRGLFADSHDVHSPNGTFDDIVFGRIDERPAGYASVYGPAMESEIASLFGVRGKRRVTQVGCAAR
jgi:hypothetical protein